MRAGSPYLFGRKGAASRAQVMTKPRKPGNRSRPVMIQNVAYPSIGDAATALGIHPTTLARRLRDGWPVAEAIGQRPHVRTMPGKSLRYRGTTYPSIKALAEAIGVRPTTFGLRLAQGRSVKEAVEFEKRHAAHRAQSITFNGRTFASKSALAEHYGTKWSVVGRRIKNGWTMAQALGRDAPPPRFRNHLGHAREQHWKQIQIIEGRRLPAASAGEYRLYLITNTRNGKEYVGITTNDLGSRLRGHFALAKKGRKSHLYNAMRHYGRSAFRIDLLRNDARTFAELQQQEVEEIARRDAIRQGYNTGLGGALGTSKAIRIGDTVFQSQAAAAAHFGIDVSVFNARLTTLGWTPEQAAEIAPRPTYGARRVEVDGKLFRSLTAAARAYGLNPKAVHARISAHGWTLRQALELDPLPQSVKSRGIPLSIRGKQYRSVEEAARAHGVDSEALGRRVRAGQSPDDALREALATRERREERTRGASSSRPKNRLRR